MAAARRLRGARAPRQRCRWLLRDTVGGGADVVAAAAGAAGGVRKVALVPEAARRRRRPFAHRAGEPRAGVGFGVRAKGREGVDPPLQLGLGVGAQLEALAVVHL